MESDSGASAADPPSVAAACAEASPDARVGATSPEPIQADATRAGATPIPQATDERAIILLSGMHRSGTSALARVLNLLGAVLPEPLLPPSLGNDAGHWEPAAAVEMNDAALAAAGSGWGSLYPLSAKWRHDGSAERFIKEIAAWLDDAAPMGATTVVKDPRISVLAPFWREAIERLGLPARVVVSWRDPAEVAHSLSRRQAEADPDGFWPLERGELLWLKHNLELEHASRGALRSFVSYSRLLDDWRPVMQRVFDDLGLAMPEAGAGAHAAVDDFLRHEHRHQRRSSEAVSRAEVADTVKALTIAAEEPGAAERIFDSPLRTFVDATNCFGGYLQQLETRVSEGGGGDMGAVVHALHAALRASDQRATLAVRRAQTQQGDVRQDRAEAPGELHTRHEALLAAHRQLSADLRQAKDEVREARRAALDQHALSREMMAAQAGHMQAQTHLAAAEAKLAAAEAELSSARDDAERAVAEADKLREEAAAQRLGREAAERAVLDGERSRREADRRHLRQADLLQVAEQKALGLQASLAHVRAEADRLAGEIEDQRAAFEHLRLENLETRRAAAKQAAAQETEAAERAAVRETALQAVEQAAAREAEAAERAAVRETALQKELEHLRQAALGQVATLQAEAQALRQSSSWRITRPMRSVSFRLRRLVRS